MLPHLPELGIGIVWWPGLESITAEPGLIDVVEIEPQAFFLETHPRGRVLCPEAVVDELRGLPHRKLLHGVGTPIGSPRDLDPRQLPLLRHLRQTLQPAWCSEHLAFQRADTPLGRSHAGFFLPPRQSDAGVTRAATAVTTLRAALDAPLLIETGTNYLRQRQDELPDGEFVARIADTADCGILLDLHNAWTNERNGRQPVREFVASLPAERVVEIHVAGGFELDGFWLDAHSGNVPPPVFDLLAELLPALPAVAALVFEILPDHIQRLGVNHIAAQLHRLREIWDARTRHVWPTPSRPPAVPFAALEQGPSPIEWEDTLASLVLGQDQDSLLAHELAADPGLPLLRRLVDEFRAGAVAATLPRTIRLLARQHGEHHVRALLLEHASVRGPEPFSRTEALQFARTLRSWLVNDAPTLAVLDREVAQQHRWLRSVAPELDSAPWPMRKTSSDSCCE
ncbi:MAG: DUF692 family protein [Planctomycetes bacterium]|nr:DUF692 family protein [Planctomycetota bacterium]